MSTLTRRDLLVCMASFPLVTLVREAVHAQDKGSLGLWEGGRQLKDFPLYTQPDNISCGPTCCAMVLAWYGIQAGIGPLKTKAGTRWIEAGDWKFGMTLPGGMVDALATSGLPASLRRGTLEDLTRYIDQDRSPIVLARSGRDKWHYVVATGYRNGTGEIQLADPVGERYWINGDRLDNAWTFSHDLNGQAIEGRRCRTCGGTGKVAKGWTYCKACGGSGQWKAFGGWTTCAACGGEGKWSSGGVNCPTCGGDGRETDYWRKAVESFGTSGHTFIVPTIGRKPSSGVPIGTVWSYGTGEFRSVGTGQWQEFQNGQHRCSFRETGRSASAVTLYDGSRNITVTLTASQATVTRGSQTVLTYRGGWSWQEWTNGNGQGKFAQTSPGRWVEYQNGRQAFTFTEKGRGSSNEVNLYDASRAITVKLDPRQATVTRGGNTLLTMNGRWTR